MTSLYIHIPFCLKKCLFCSFVIAVGQAHRVDDYLAALEKEALKFKGEHVSTIYFGGGTPTFLNENQLERLIALVRRNFNCDENAEWTIEANPEGMSASKAKLLKDLGINRISLGVQSVNERYLKFLGRAHDRSLALEAFGHLRSAGFNNINIDLMYAFPGQTKEEIKEDIDLIASLKSEHVSLYTLTIEEKSRFYAEGLKLDDEDLLAEHYVFVCELLGKHGIEQYEVSNFCRDGHYSQHNLNYWKGGNYIGLGVGAHAHVNGKRSWNVSKLQEYFSSIDTKGEAVDGFEQLSDETRLMELFVIGLRMNDGVDLAELERKVNVVCGADKLQRINQFVDDGFLISEGRRFKATDQGRLILDELSSRLI